MRCATLHEGVGDVLLPAEQPSSSPFSSSGRCSGRRSWGSSRGAACARTSIACASHSALSRRRLLGLVALILAFGLTMAVGRYDTRRAAVVDDANAIGTTYLRAQTLREPIRTRSLECSCATRTPAFGCRSRSREAPAARDAIADGDALQRSLWRLGGQALADSPTDSAPRLYVETLNEMIDMQTVRCPRSNNRVPTAVLVIEIVGAAVGLGLLAPVPRDPRARRGHGRPRGRRSSRCCS